MPLRNRVTPLGVLIETRERGLVFGNRGRLHGDDRLIRRNHDGRRWIACRLEFRGRRREPMPRGRYTGLFFLDEATALAAGHRPCAECRHDDYRSFFDQAGAASADELDRRLHGERLGDDIGGRRLHETQSDELPDGAFVLLDGAAYLVLGDALLRWTPGGYAERRPRPRGHVDAITPPTSLRVLGSGWAGSLPLIHPSGPDALAGAIASDGVVTLKAPRPGDSRLLIEGRDGEFFRWLGPGAEVPQPVACVWANGHLVGWVDYDLEHAWLRPGEVNVGYYLFPAARGKGYASRAVELLLVHLRRDTEHAVATLLVHPLNVRSLALARRLGFAERGEVDGQLFFTHGVKT